MTHRIFLVLTLVLSLHARAAHADKPIKIGVIDVEKILLQSSAGKAGYAELKALQTQKEQQLAAKSAEAKAAQDKLAADRSKLSAAQVAAAQKDVDAKAAAVRAFAADADKELATRRDATLAALDAKLMPAVDAYAKSKGFTLVFKKFESGLVFVDDAIDISDDIVKTLNK